MNTHELKIWPVHFKNVRAGTKTFEIRKNDRAFQKGDHVELKEYDPEAYSPSGRCNGCYTGISMEFKIGDVYPIDAERVVFSLLAIDKDN